MNAKHTPEPWRIRVISGNVSIIYGGSGRMVIDLPVNASAEDAANFSRIVSCVNALAGIANPTEAINAAREALKKQLWFRRECGGECLRLGQPKCVDCQTREALAALKG